MNTRTTGMLLSLAVLGSLVGCGSSGQPGAAAPSSSAAAAYPLTVKDCGKDVTLKAAPRSVMTVGGAAISLLDAAGASDRITARAGEFTAPLPSGLKHPPTGAKVIDPQDPSTEAILGTSADLVYGYGLFNAKPADLAKAGVQTLTVAPECGHDAGDSGSAPGMAAIPAEIRRLGKVFGTEKDAEQSAVAYEEGLKAADMSNRPAGRAAWVYHFGPTDPLSAFGRPGIPGDILRRAGLTNVFPVDKPYITTSVEALLKQDPDWIILGYAPSRETAQQALTSFSAQAGAASLSAVKKGHVVVVGPDASQPAPTSLDGLKQVASAVHAS